VLVSGLAGFIDGHAPLFERFTLGDVRTLRGWDKYDISPAGAERMFHGSLEYRFSVVQLFVDVGSVWNEGTERKIRASTGVGVVAGPVFMTVGVPIDTNDLRAVFMMGYRFGSFGFTVKK
jgi:outer membrane protein assembly factor BamA